jgi:2-C-methyl-D-erythritol 4-phosphate cytidylyltransferase
VFGLLEGRKVNLRVVEKEDLPLLQEWWNNPDFAGI